MHVSKDDYLRSVKLKLALLGDPAVGKTSLINMYTQHRFSSDYQPTLGVNIIVKELALKDINTYVRLVLWDIAGQDKYDLGRKRYFQGILGALLIFDTTRDLTFKNIELKWLKDMKDFGEKDPVYILIGNKIDLKDSRLVSAEEGKNLAEKIKAIDYIETSAKYGDYVEIAFQKLVYHVLFKLGFITDISLF